ncbi:MAG: D-alanine--D-alanine ligase [Planctomycetota bacterium]
MLVGLTYDLRDDYLKEGYTEEETAEFDRLSTIEALESTLKELGHEVERVGNARHLIQSLASGRRWDLVFNIAEGLRGIAREAQVPAILDVYDIPYTFSDPLVMALTLHKGITKRLVRAAGIPTPDFLEVERLADLNGLEIAYPLFAKPVAEGTGKGIDEASIVHSPQELRKRCAWLLEHFSQSVLVEQYMDGREFTVGVVGTGDEARVLGTIEVILLENAEKGVYSYVNKERCEELVEYRLVHADKDEEVKRAEEVALATWKVLNCRDGGRLDLRSDRRGQPHLLELNPLAGLHPEHSDLPILCNKLGIPYVDLIRWITESAAQRCKTR